MLRQVGSKQPMQLVPNEILDINLISSLDCHPVQFCQQGPQKFLLSQMIYIVLEIWGEKAQTLFEDPNNKRKEGLQISFTPCYEQVGQHISVWTVKTKTFDGSRGIRGLSFTRLDDSRMNFLISSLGCNPVQFCLQGPQNFCTIPNFMYCVWNIG